MAQPASEKSSATTAGQASACAVFLCAKSVVQHRAGEQYSDLGKSWAVIETSVSGVQFLVVQAISLTSALTSVLKIPLCTHNVGMIDMTPQNGLHRSDDGCEVVLDVH